MATVRPSTTFGVVVKIDTVGGRRTVRRASGVAVTPDGIADANGIFASCAGVGTL